MVAGNNFFNLTKGASVSYQTIPPPPNASPLVISISSPKNNSVYNVNNITVSFNVSTPKTFGVTYFQTITCNASWLDKKIYVYQFGGPTTFVNFNENYLIPEGNHTIRIVALGKGNILEGWLNMSYYEMTTTDLIYFIVDTTSPKVSILSLENKTIDSSDVSLNFSLSEKAGLVKYSLDGQKNSTLYGNMTLTGLVNARHNLTVYAWDVAGNLGVSETVFFDVDKQEPFLTTFVIASVSIVGIVVLGILAYFKKKRRT